MILLPHGCKCSQPIVNPNNWKTCGKTALKKAWRITYRFYDPQFKGTDRWGKLFSVKGMNRFRTLEERRMATQKLMDDEIYEMKIEGFNPITGEYNGPDIYIQYEIHPNTPFCEALDSAFSKLDLQHKTLIDIKGAKKYFIKSVKQLRYEELKIKDVRRRHVRAILENQVAQNKYSNNRYNKIRAYISILFKELLENDAIEVNPISAISKKKTVKRIRLTLTDEEIEKVKKHLKSNYYTFYRYWMIFYHSGCRSSELMRLQMKDIILDKQLFKIQVKKGRTYQEEWRAINDSVLGLWKETCKNANKHDFLFSKGLIPGPVKIDEWQISKRWREHVKKKLGIEADFYAIKHVHTTKVTEYYGRLLASKINGHKSTKMNDRHYDILRESRLLEEAKSIDVKL